ncbi:anti-sigma-D factor RsdA [Rhodococcus sp. G-MC3]|uniref:anti-sigma-D factor RsdA n=1 Tax=Rhodococcus sp. G-MC3 TaxID=3046209 RepID=UPI0024BA3477|nr:anti-sigma-D factor RsdA [Rhodococcus sp. G-MC3]MDJ0392700.1 anti-sigma-D factor RsdA [Rhodococcus sp. G-MC3]
MARNNGRDGIPRIGRLEGSAPTPASGVSYGDFASDSGPVDIAAVRRDDEFIEAIRGDGPIATDDADEYQLALLLANWRSEIVSPALPIGPDLSEVAAAVDSEIAAAGLRRRASARSRGLLRPVAGAAAAIALVLGGLVVFSYNSAPGDPLWSVKSVVFSQQADSTAAQIDTTSKLEQAEQLIASGDVNGAQALLAGAAETTGSVTDQAQKSDLEIWLQRLLEQVQAAIPTIPAPLPAPSEQIPMVPVPGVQEVPPAPPVTEVPPVPPVLTTIDPALPPVTGVPVTPVLPSAEPITPTTAPDLSVLREPTPTATASGATGEGSQTSVNTLENGG